MNMISRHWEVARTALAEDRASAQARVRRTEGEFLPAALEIIERPVSPTARLTAWLLIGGLILIIAWAIIGKVDVVASAPGRLVPVNNVKLVQSSEGGVVRAILVRNGQKVRKGQVLVELDPTVSGAEVEQARRALQAAQLDVAREQAVLSALDGRGLKFEAPTGVGVEIIATQRELAAAEFASAEASIAGRGADVTAARAARQEALVQAAKLNETLPLLDEQLNAYEGLLTKGYAAKLKVVELRRQRLAALKDRDAALAAAARAQAQSSGAGTQLQQSRAEVRAGMLERIAKAQLDARLRYEELVKSEQRSRLQRLVAPADGTVAQLSVHTIGGVAEAAKPLMVIVPSDGALIAEVQILNKDVGFVQLGQPVSLKLEAFSFTRFGTISGTVESLGSDAVEDERLGLVYPARIRIGSNAIDRGDRIVKLTAGLSLTADIKTGRRRIVSYLLGPIEEACLRAGRER